MPWILIPGALRRIRRERKLDRKAAAKLVGIDERTLQRHESKDLAPRTLQYETVEHYCDGYGVPKESFVHWVDHDEDKTARKPRADRTAPPIATLTQKAKHELLVKGHKSVRVGDESLEIVGPTVLRECMNTFLPYEGRRFVVAGTIQDSDYIPEAAAKVLGAKLGEGARYRVDREVVKELDCYVTVFAPISSQTLHLQKCQRSDKPVALVVRVFVKIPDEYWKGFFIFEKKPKPRPWAFVVESLLPSVPTGT